MKQLFKDFEKRAAEWRAANNKAPDAAPSLDDLYTREEQHARLMESGVLGKDSPPTTATSGTEKLGHVDDTPAEAERITAALRKFHEEAEASLEALCALGRSLGIRVAVLVESGERVVGGHRYLSFPLNADAPRTPLTLALTAHAKANAKDPGMAAVLDAIGMLAEDSNRRLGVRPAPAAQGNPNGVAPGVTSRQRGRS